MQIDRNIKELKLALFYFDSSFTNYDQTKISFEIMVPRNIIYLYSNEKVTFQRCSLLFNI